MTLQFYMTPGSCSTGIHILLETLELPFQVTVLNLPAGDHRQPRYLAINPKGTIPALQLPDGLVLTEFQAIALWLARQYPRARLLPEAPAAMAAAMALMDHVVGTVHGQGYTRIFTPEAYLPAGLTPEQRAHWEPAIQARGRDIVTQGLNVIAAQLSEAPYALGADFSVVDAALFYVEFWADKIQLPLPDRCAAHYRLMRTRPAVRQVLAEEGYR